MYRVICVVDFLGTGEVMRHPHNRDVAQWLERCALPISLPAVRSRIPLSPGLSEKYNVCV